MKITTFLGLLVLGFVLFIWSQATSTASVESVRDVIITAQRLPATKAFVEQKLAINPTPTNYEIVEISSEVNKMLVQDLSTTTAASRAPGTVAASAVPEVTAKEANNEKSSEPLTQVIYWLVVILAVMLPIKMVLYKINTRNSPSGSV